MANNTSNGLRLIVKHLVFMDMSCLEHECTKPAFSKFEQSMQKLAKKIRSDRKALVEINADLLKPQEKKQYGN